MPEPIETLIYQFKVVLRRVSPMIWRRLLVRSDSTIADLHHTLQIALGWTDSHLHRFRICARDFGVYGEQQQPGGQTARDKLSG